MLIGFAQQKEYFVNEHHPQLGGAMNGTRFRLHASPCLQGEGRVGIGGTTLRNNAALRRIRTTPVVSPYLCALGFIKSETRYCEFLPYPSLINKGGHGRVHDETDKQQFVRMLYKFDTRFILIGRKRFPEKGLAYFS